MSNDTIELRDTSRVSPLSPGRVPPLSMQPIWNITLFADGGLESFINVRPCVDDGYRAIGELVSSDELLDG